MLLGIFVISLLASGAQGWVTCACGGLASLAPETLHAPQCMLLRAVMALSGRVRRVRVERRLRSLRVRLDVVAEPRQALEDAFTGRRTAGLHLPDMASRDFVQLEHIADLLWRPRCSPRQHMSSLTTANLAQTDTYLP